MRFYKIENPKKPTAKEICGSVVVALAIVGAYAFLRDKKGGRK